MTDWTYNNFLVTPMKYNEPFTMNDKQLARFKAGKKVFSEGKCAVVKDISFVNNTRFENKLTLSDKECYAYIHKMWSPT